MKPTIRTSALVSALALMLAAAMPANAQQYNGGYGPGMMGYGIMGSGMIGPMMGPGMMGPGMMRYGYGYGGPPVSLNANIVTTDKDALVQRFAVDRRSGYWQQIP